MTTAHRPTWTPAVGGTGTRGNWATGGMSQQFSAQDQLGQTKLKFRQIGQNSEAELKRRDLRMALEDNEERAVEEKRSSKPSSSSRTSNRLENGSSKSSSSSSRSKKEEPLLLTEHAEEDLLAKAKKYDDADDDDSESDLSDSDDDNDSDDEEEALQRELEKIRKERDEVRARKDAEEAEAERRAAQEAAMSGNALLNPLGAGSSQVKRRWNDDVVFKGQARTEPEKKKRFINDTIRSDFHRSFLKKYIR